MSYIQVNIPVNFISGGGIVSKIQLSVLGANYVSYILLSMLIEISCRWFGVEPRTG